MGRGSGADQNGTEAAQRGLWRLMLKLPALRGRLQILAVRSSSLNDLFEAYEEASAVLEQLLREREKADVRLIDEYETICEEIETDIIQYVISDRSRISD